MDAPRQLLVAALAGRPDLDLETLSHAIGRHRAYLRQYVMRGSPRELPDAERLAVAARLGLKADDLRAGGARAGAPPAAAGLAERRNDLPVYRAR